MRKCFSALPKQPMLPDILLRTRDRLLADPKVLRWAGRFPLTRPIARQRTRALFDLAAGFIHAQVLAACVRLDLFELLAERPRGEAEIALACNLPPRGVASLVQAAVALDLLSWRRGGRVGLGSLGAALRGTPAVAAMVAHHALLYVDFADPVALLRAPGQGRLAAFWGYAGNDAAADLTAAQTGDYTGLMAASQAMIAEQVLAAYDFRRHRCLLDVGGGDGSFLRAVAASAPGLDLMLFDLPEVARQAAERFAAAGLPGARCVGGDFRTGALPGGADVVSFVRVLHDHDDATVAQLLAAARKSLADGGRVLIAEPMADAPSAAAYFSMYLHAMGTGRPRRAAELMAALRQAGFVRPRRLRTPTPLLTGVLLADV